ncbi:CrcB family protein [Microbacterium aurum]
MRGRKAAFPVGILVVNIIGSFLLGLITGLGGAPRRRHGSRSSASGGSAGFTTFSTVSAETVLLAPARASRLGVAEPARHPCTVPRGGGAGLPLGGLPPR